ncbi:MAG: hypothetical protein ABIA63_08690 [bacterium]
MKHYKSLLEKYDLSAHIDDTIDSIKFDEDEKIIKEILVLNKDMVEKTVKVNLINSIDSQDYDRKLQYLLTKNNIATLKKAIKHIMVQQIISGTIMGIEVALKHLKDKKQI